MTSSFAANNDASHYYGNANSNSSAINNISSNSSTTNNFGSNNAARLDTAPMYGVNYAYAGAPQPHASTPPTTTTTAMSAGYGLAPTSSATMAAPMSQSNYANYTATEYAPSGPISYPETSFRAPNQSSSSSAAAAAASSRAASSMNVGVDAHARQLAEDEALAQRLQREMDAAAAGVGSTSSPAAVPRPAAQPTRTTVAAVANAPVVEDGAMRSCPVCAIRVSAEFLPLHVNEHFEAEESNARASSQQPAKPSSSPVSTQQQQQPARRGFLSRLLGTNDAPRRQCSLSYVIYLVCQRNNIFVQFCSCFLSAASPSASPTPQAVALQSSPATQSPAYSNPNVAYAGQVRVIVCCLIVVFCLLFYASRARIQASSYYPSAYPGVQQSQPPGSGYSSYPVQRY